ncbi:hypothetical protein [Paenibacillus chungangensis]|uniref:Uncharacterized protein n=1 Tax=Paenibacillus chungangensis TaxID=696535 RepID=A0ABW3HN26_9BACL
MQKPRLIPVVLTAAATAVLLFGGWGIYKQLAVSAPLHDMLHEVNGIAYAAEPVIDKDKVAVTVQLSEDASLREVYGDIAREVKDIAGDKQLEVSIKDEVDEELERLWHASLFDIAEAMETKTYSAIPAAMEKAVQGSEQLEVDTEMDNTNVYITMKNGAATKHIVLPRTPQQLGVWPNA